MRLTEQEQAMLNGEFGPGFARAMRVLVGIGKAFGAQRMVPISRGHISLSNQEGDLWFVSQMLEEGAHCRVPPTVNPAYDYEYFKTVSRLDEENERILKSTIDVYRKLGAILTFDCTPIFENNVPRFGEICSFSASGGAVYVNSVLGARSNREAAQSAMCAAITGVTPEYGLLLKENRAGDVLIRVEADVATEYDYELLGYCTPKKMGQAYHQPVFEGLSPQTTAEQLMNLGTQLNVHGIVPMFHVAGVTPEAPDVETAFQGRKDYPVVTVTDEDLAQARREISAGAGKADFCILGCPHLTIGQVGSIAAMLEGQKLAGQLYIFTSTSTRELARRMGYLDVIHAAGGEIVINSCVDQPCWSHLNGMSGVTESPKCAYYTKRWNMAFTVKSIPACIQSVLKGEIVE